MNNTTLPENEFKYTGKFREEESNGLKISELWAMVWNHKIWYIVSIVICLIYSVYHLYKTPTLYQRQAKVMIDESNQDATMRNLGVISAGSMRLRSFNSVENEIEAFSSPDLMEMVVERMGLQTKYTQEEILRNVELYKNSPIEMRLAGDNPSSGFRFKVKNIGEGGISLYEFRFKDEKFNEIVNGEYGDTLVTPVGKVVIYKTADTEKFEHPIIVSWTNLRSSAIAHAKRLNISLSGKESSVIVLGISDSYQSRADGILNHLIDAYNEVWINNKNRAAINTSEFISERLIHIERDLNQVENELKEYKSNNQLTDINAVAKSYLDESSKYAAKSFEVNNQLSIAEYIKDYLNNPANYNALIPSNLGLANSGVDVQIGEYNSMMLQRDRLSKGSGSNNPLVTDLNSSIESIRGAILRSVDNMIATLELQIEKIESQERQIVNRISANSDREMQLLSLQRRQHMTQSLYMFLLEKREENELAALVNVGNTRLIATPTGTGSPVSPNKMMILFAALVLGFGLPFAYFFLMKMLDTRIKNRADLGNLAIPFLAEIPFYATKENSSKFIRKSRKVRQKSRIIVEPGKRDMMNEAFRVLRTNIDLMIDKKGKSQVIMFTSFNPSAGKTFTLMNIAAGMALKESKVILVDLDLRKASLSKDLGLVHTGVAAYLNGKSDDYKACLDRVAKNLDVLPVGTLPPNPTELLLTERFGKMMEELRQEYDYIFLDCPPIEIVADSSLITKFCDMTVFVMRAGRINKDVLPQIHELYESGKYNHMSLLLNGVDIQFKRYGYGKSSYGYGYGYSSNSDSDEK